MTRIIAGAFGGRRIQTPKGDGTRPTSDRVREALFSSLESELGGWHEIVVLDLFAGSGALGLEALSRGALDAHFNELDSRAARVIRHNIKELGSGGSVTSLKAEQYVQDPTQGSYGLVFIDPPYAMSTAKVQAIVADVARFMLEPDGLIVVERSTRDPFEWPEGIDGIRSKKYGETTLWFGRPAVRSLA